MKKYKKNINNIILLIILIILLFTLQGYHFTTRGLLRSTVNSEKYGKITKYEMIAVDSNNDYCICQTDKNKVILTLIHKKFKFLKYTYGLAVYDIDQNKINNFMIRWQEKWLMFGMCHNDAIANIRFTMSNGTQLFIPTCNSFYKVNDFNLDFSSVGIARIEMLDHKNNVINSFTP